jgi:hypothetical protein
VDCAPDLEPVVLILFKCIVGTGASQLLTSRPLAELVVVAGELAQSPEGDEGKEDRCGPNVVEFLVRGVCSRHVSTLKKLEILSTVLSKAEMASLCQLLRNVDGNECRVRDLLLVNNYKGGENVLDDGRVAEFFHALPDFPHLRSIEFEHQVRRRELANAVVNGVRSNETLTSLEGLRFVNPLWGAADKIDLWIRANVMGRSTLQASLGSLVVGGGDDAAPVRRSMIRILEDCASSVNMDPEASQALDLDFSVLYHFVRELLPLLATRGIVGVTGAVPERGDFVEGTVVEAGQGQQGSVTVEDAEASDVVDDAPAPRYPHSLSSQYESA